MLKLLLTFIAVTSTLVACSDATTTPPGNTSSSGTSSGESGSEGGNDTSSGSSGSQDTSATDNNNEWNCTGSLTCQVTTTEGPQGSKKLIFDAPGGACQFREPSASKKLEMEGGSLRLEGEIVGNYTTDGKTSAPTSFGYDVGDGAVQLSSCTK